MTPEQIAALVAQNASLMAKNAELEAAVNDQTALSIKVSEKGAVQINGFGRWPVTLYKSQVIRLIDETFLVKLRAFIVANDSMLVEKSKRTATAAA